MLCSKCKKKKESEAFSFKSKKKNRRHTMCKSCHSEYRRNHYLQNKKKYITKALKWNKNQGKILSRFLFEKLSKSKCVDCGERDILVLEFEHTDDKRLGIAQMYQGRYSLKAVKHELKNVL